MNSLGLSRQIVILHLCVLLVGCIKVPPEHQAWHEATIANTEEAYEEFFQKYPNFWRTRDQRAWERAREENTVESYEAYLSEFRLVGRHLSEAERHRDQLKIAEKQSLLQTINDLGMAAAPQTETSALVSDVQPEKNTVDGFELFRTKEYTKAIDALVKSAENSKGKFLIKRLDRLSVCYFFTNQFDKALKSAKGVVKEISDAFDEKRLYDIEVDDFPQLQTLPHFQDIKISIFEYMILVQNNPGKFQAQANLDIKNKFSNAANEFMSLYHEILYDGDDNYYSPWKVRGRLQKVEDISKELDELYVKINEINQ